MNTMKIDLVDLRRTICTAIINGYDCYSFRLAPQLEEVLWEDHEIVQFKSIQLHQFNVELSALKRYSYALEHEVMCGFDIEPDVLLKLSLRLIAANRLIDWMLNSGTQNLIVQGDECLI